MNIHAAYRFSACTLAYAHTHIYSHVDVRRTVFAKPRTRLHMQKCPARQYCMADAMASTPSPREGECDRSISSCRGSPEHDPSEHWVIPGPGKLIERIHSAIIIQHYMLLNNRPYLGYAKRLCYESTTAWGVLDK